MSEGRSRTKAKANERRFPVPILIGVGLLLVVAAVLAIRKPGPGAAIEVRGAPSLRADPPRIDFGEVKLGRTVTAVFELSNVGDQPLEFARVPYVEVIEGC